MAYRLQQCASRHCEKEFKMAKGSVCGDCERKLDGHQDLTEKLKALESVKLVPYIFPEDHKFIHRTTIVDEDSKEAQAFNLAMIDLLENLCTHKTDGQGGHMLTTGFGASDSFHRPQKGRIYYFPEEAKYPFNRFGSAMKRYLARSYANGVERGRDLLSQLNEGDITPDQIQNKVDDIERLCSD